MSDLPTAGELESELEAELQKLQTLHDDSQSGNKDYSRTRAQRSVDSLGISSNNFEPYTTAFHLTICCWPDGRYRLH